MAGTPLVELVQHDYSLIPLLNVVAEPVAGSVVASATNVGKLYRNTVSGRLELVLNATTIVSLPHSTSIVDADIATGAAIANTKLATNPLARVNHTGTQLAATVSDFDAQVNTHRLDQLLAPSVDLSVGTHKIINLSDGSVASDAAAWGQVQNLVNATINGHDWKDGVVSAPSTNVTVANPGTYVYDGITLPVGARVLLMGQTAPAENGIYLTGATAATALVRTADANTSAMVTSGMTVPVEQGTNTGLAILTTPDPIVLATTGLSFTVIKGAAVYTAGTGIGVAGNVISLTVPVAVVNGGTGGTTAPAARTALGAPQRGAAGTLGAITAGGTITFPHGLNTLDVNVQVYRLSDGANVNIGLARTDVNTITISADVAVVINTLRCVVTPIA